MGVGLKPRIRARRRPKEIRLPDFMIDLYDWEEAKPERFDHPEEIEGWPGDPPPLRERKKLPLGAGAYLYGIYLDKAFDNVGAGWIWVVIRARHGELYEGVVAEIPDDLEYSGERDYLRPGDIVFFKADHVFHIDYARDKQDVLLEYYGADFFEDSWRWRGDPWERGVWP